MQFSNKMHSIGAAVLWAVLTVSTPMASAQEEQQPQTPPGEASTNIFSNHGFVGISQHGNIVRFNSPTGSEHIRVGAIREGYALCSSNGPIIIGPVAGPVVGPAIPPLVGPTVVAYDAGDVEGGFGAATIVQPTPNALPLTITRTTSNGLRLTQTYAIDSAQREVTVTMTVRNVSGATRWNVRLDRYFDGDINGTTFNDLYARTLDSVWGFENASHGLMLTDISSPAVPHATAVHTFGAWVPASCGQASGVTPTAAGDYVGRLSYTIGTLVANAQRTVKVNYRRF